MCNKKGSTLLLVVGVLALLIVFSIGMITIANRSFSDTTGNVRNQQAYFIAKSVLTTFVDDLENDDVKEILNLAKKSPTVTYTTEKKMFNQNSDQTYWLEVVFDANTMLATLTAYGKVNDQDSSLSATLKLSHSDFFLEKGAIISTGYSKNGLPFDGSKKQENLLVMDDPAGALNGHVYYNVAEENITLWQDSQVRGNIYVSFAPSFNHSFTVNPKAHIYGDLIVNGTVTVKGIVEGTIYAKKVDCKDVNRCSKIVLGDDLPQFDIFKNIPPDKTVVTIPKAPTGTYSVVEGSADTFDGNKETYYEFDQNTKYSAQDFIVNTRGKDIHFKNADTFFNNKDSRTNWQFLGNGNVYFYSDNDLKIDSLNMSTAKPNSPNVYILSQKSIDITNKRANLSVDFFAHLLAQDSIVMDPGGATALYFHGSIIAKKININPFVDCIFYPLDTSILESGGGSINKWSLVEYKK